MRSFRIAFLHSVSTLRCFSRWHLFIQSVYWNSVWRQMQYVNLQWTKWNLSIWFR